MPVGELLPSQPITDKRLLFKNFIYYHKWHMLVGAALLAAVASFAYSVATKVKPDVNVAVVGEFPLYSFNQEAFERELLEASPGFEAISVDSAVEMGLESDPQMAQAIQIKKMVLVTAADIDVFVCDGAFFEEMAVEGLFMPFEAVERIGGFHVEGARLAFSGGVAYGATLLGGGGAETGREPESGGPDTGREPESGGADTGMEPESGEANYASFANYESLAGGEYRDGPGIGGMLGGGAPKILCLSANAANAEKGAQLIAALIVPP